MSTSIFDPVDLATLPLPKIIEEPTFDAIYAEMLELFQSLEPTYTLLTEADPVVKVIQAFSYRELVQRNRINTVVRAMLLPYATGSDLDNLAAFYDIQRRVVTPATVVNNLTIPAVMESDDILRYRIQLKSPSTAGGADQYKYWAISADPRVKDVAVYSPDFENEVKGGKIIIAVLSTETGGTPSPDLLAAVRLAVGRDDVRALNDIVEVIPAAVKNFAIEANIKLYPSVPQSEIGEAAGRITTALNEAISLGRDITRSWLISVMQTSKIHSIQLVQPSMDIVVKPDEFPQLTSLRTNFLGYSDAEGYGTVEITSIRTQRQVNDIYIAYAISHRRTVDEIQDDLMVESPLGVIQPTVRGLCQYLNLIGTKDSTTGLWLPEDELCFLIWRNISPKYDISIPIPDDSATFLTNMFAFPQTINSLRGGGLNDLDGQPTLNIEVGTTVCVTIDEQTQFYQLQLGFPTANDIATLDNPNTRWRRTL